VQRWPETKRLLGLLVNSSGGAHARNARRLVHAARKQDRRLSAAILAAAVAHTPEAMEVIRGARTRMARKPSALSRELLRNFPKGRKGRNRRRRRKGDQQEAAVATEEEVLTTLETPDETDGEPGIDKPGVPEEDVTEGGDYADDEDRTDADWGEDEPPAEAEAEAEKPKPKPRSRRRKPPATEEQSAVLAAAEAVAAAAEAEQKPKRRRAPRKKTDDKPEAA
jgi:hypothetical protein